MCPYRTLAKMIDLQPSCPCQLGKTDRDNLACLGGWITRKSVFVGIGVMAGNYFYLRLIYFSRMLQRRSSDMARLH